MEQIGEFLGEAEMGSEIYAGAARLYERVAAQCQSAGRDCPPLAELAAFFGAAKRSDPA